MAEKIFCTNMFVIVVSDIDETLENNCGCEDTCTNMFVDRDNKTHECSCNNTGYELGPNGHSCEGEHLLILANIPNIWLVERHSECFNS